MVARTELETAVLEQIRPGIDEKDHLYRVADRLVRLADASGEATGMVVGSVARETWIRGDRDLDIFMLFPPDLSREGLEERGLSLAREIADKAGGTYFEKYAEHPYIHARIEGLQVDIVPCYQVADASSIRSAVDRTPFHTLYIRHHIGGLIDDILLLKQFAKNGGIYGSDQMTEGFSGYLCELLIIYYQGFLPLLKAASSWYPGICIDIEGHRTKDFSEPMVMVDPVDPGRNVSASVSLTRMCEFIELARGYLECPGEGFFFSPPPHVFSYGDAGEEIRRRGTTLYALSFQTPPYIEEIIVPQLRKSLEAISSLLERHEFVVSRADYCMKPEKSLLLFEMLVDTLPPVRRHYGPPLWAGENSGKFAGKYRAGEEGSVYTGPYIEQGRYIVEVSRRYRSALDLFMSPELLGIGLGRHVRDALVQSYSVRSGEECYDKDFAPFITAFLEKESPLTRILRKTVRD